MKHFFSSDEDLTALSNQLEHLTFELTEADHAQFSELQQLGSLKNVSLYMGSGRTFRVRLCIGGKQHVIGVTRKGPNAARFADMARLYFWPYRMRDKRLPEDSEFNFGIVDTQHALETHHEAVRLLERIRDHLIKVAKLATTNTASETERAQRAYVRDTRRTVRGELLQIHEESIERAKILEAALASFEKTIASNTLLFEQIKLAFHHILEQLALAGKEREQIRQHLLPGETSAAPVWVTTCPGIPTPAPRPDIVWCAASGKLIT